MIDVLNIIEQYALTKTLKSFYPSAIVQQTDLPIAQVKVFLDSLVDNGTLEVNYEIRCSDDVYYIDTVKDFKKYLGKEMDCYDCNETFEVTLDNIFPVYSVSESYRNRNIR